MQNKITKEQNAKSAQNYVNEFEICGNITHKNAASDSLVLRIKTENPITHKIDYHWVVFYDSDIRANLDSSVAAGDRITVKGYICTSKKRKDGSIVGTWFQKEQSRIDVAFEGGELKEDRNAVIIKGRLDAEPYAPSDKVTILTVKTVSEAHRTYFIKIVCFGVMAKLAKDKKKGNPIQLLCYIKTNKKDPAGKISTMSFIAQAMK